VTFPGFGEAVVDFYEGLEADNSKAYWTDNKALYDDHVRAPMVAMLADLEPEFGPGKVFRPYRDVRFAADKTPYKVQCGATVGGRYVQVSADGLLVAGGYYACATDQSQRLRSAVVDEHAGPELEGVLAQLVARGCEIGGDRLKRVPKPLVEALGDHDGIRADVVRAKTLSAARHFPPDDVLHTPEVRDRVAENWRALGPLNAWLRDRVGASRAAPR